MDVIQVLFELLFPTEILQAGQKVWNRTPTNERAVMMAETFGEVGKLIPSAELARVQWDEFRPEERAQLVLTMCYTDNYRDALERELKDIEGAAIALSARSLCAPLRLQ